MQNTLYLGPYKESNGLGRSSRRFLDCLSIKEDINLSCRPVFFTRNNLYKESLQYNEFEENYSDHYDCIIQHGHPSMLQYHSRFGKNIAIVEIETKNINHTGYIDHLNMMDEIIVGSSFSKNSLLIAGIKTKIKIIPEPYDISIYTKQHKPFFEYGKDEPPFIFYTIGQYTEKKNIKGIVLAFLLEFDKEENVKLFIKTDDYYQDHSDLEKIIQYEITQLKKAIKKNNTCDIDIVCGQLLDIDIVRLHQSADCYVNAVRSDGFGPCAIESKICGKQLINTKHIGSSTYINSTNSIMVEAEETNVFYTNTNPYRNFSIYETWHEPNIASLRIAMRKAYEKKEIKKNNFDINLIDQKNICDIII
jgi:glycosyltransferase involved in cell wall biosynthesis